MSLELPVMAPYTLGELLGTGGMGRVFAAEHPQRGRVAVKVLHEALVTDQGMVARMQDEAQAARRVVHPNVVRVFEHGTTSTGAPFIAMERIRGVGPGDMIRQQGPLPLARVRVIASQVLFGLAAIHRAELVHGDMKSDNVLVAAGDRATIIDFGLARAPRTRPTLLDTRMLSGTPEYMAPELIGGASITPAADLYAVGIMIYEMVTGATPFGGGTSTAVFERHVADQVVAPSVRCPDRALPVPLESVILRALDKNPSARHFNAELFATAIERAIPSGFAERMSTTWRRVFTTTATTRRWSHHTGRLATGRG